MNDPFTNALFCDNVGSGSSDVRCCYVSNQTSPTCVRNFGAKITFSLGCDNGSCIALCQNPKLIYKSETQEEPGKGSGLAPIQRFRTCLNVPSIAKFASQGVLSPEIASPVGRHVPSDTSLDGLRNVTNGVTECLTQTCKASRNQKSCSGACAAVNLLKNSTLPDIRGVNECLNKLCSGGFESLPYADADVVGIGVFSSYILQCTFLVLLWFGLFLFRRYCHKHPSNPHDIEDEKFTKQSPTPRAIINTSTTHSGVAARWNKPDITHQSLLETCLVQFHVSQCYFSATIQIAALNYGIFSNDMLVTFLLIPLSINGILPIVFGFILLYRHNRDSTDITLLTSACWLLSSIVYWVLYAHIAPINNKSSTNLQKHLAYQQFAYKLSALHSCGGYSALAVCSNKYRIGQDEITSASHKLNYLTPVLWVFSTLCFFGILAAKGIMWHREWRNRKHSQEGVQIDGSDNNIANNTTPHQEQSHGTDTMANSPLMENSQNENDNVDDYSHLNQTHTSGSALSSQAHNDKPSTSPRLDRVFNIMWFIVTPCFLAGIAIQFSLLSISTSLHMMNSNAWGFGQIVAVAVWAPPLLQYMYAELDICVIEPLKSKVELGKK